MFKWKYSAFYRKRSRVTPGVARGAEDAEEVAEISVDVVAARGHVVLRTTLDFLVALQKSNVTPTGDVTTILPIARGKLTDTTTQ